MQGMDTSAVTSPELRGLRGDALAAGDEPRARAIEAELASRQRRCFTGEELDIYDDSLRPRGVRERGLVHLEGDWHRSFHCWLVSPARRSLVVQRRALTKATYPGALDASVAGHYRAGEGLAEVCREGQEELGIELPVAALLPLGRSVDAARHGFLIDREVADVHLYATDIAPGGLGCDPGEVDAVLEVGLEAARALFCGETETAPAIEHRAGTATAVAIRAADFTVHLDRYYPRLILQALRVADGLPPLCI